MKTAIIGATRGIGFRLLRIALDEGHEVTVLAREPSRLRIVAPKLKVIKGDILDQSAVDSAVTGQDGICICIGTSPTRDLFPRRRD